MFADEVWHSRNLNQKQQSSEIGWFPIERCKVGFETSFAFFEVVTNFKENIEKL